MKKKKEKTYKCSFCPEKIKESECSTYYKCPVCKDCAKDLSYYGSS